MPNFAKFHQLKKTKKTEEIQNKNDQRTIRI